MQQVSAPPAPSAPACAAQGPLGWGCLGVVAAACSRCCPRACTAHPTACACTPKSQRSSLPASRPARPASGGATPLAALRAAPRCSQAAARPPVPTCLLAEDDVEQEEGPKSRQAPQDSGACCVRVQRWGAAPTSRAGCGCVQGERQTHRPACPLPAPVPPAPPPPVIVRTYEYESERVCDR